MKIIKTKGKITKIIDLSPTAKEIWFELENEMEFQAGAFVNLFVEIDGEKIRRSYSISSDPAKRKEISLTIREKKGGFISNIFWLENVKEMEFEIMGPLGKNTADKIKKEKVFLAGFGVGVSVIKAVLLEILKFDHVREIYILTGSYNEEEILYKDFFDEVKEKNTGKKIFDRFILSNPKNENYPFTGHIQENIDDLDFSNSSIYICGQKIACDTLKEKIKDNAAENIDFIIESFG